MEFIYDVNSQTFAEAVIQKSYEKPVAVDFWAPWCAPCRSLKPVLEGVISRLQGEVVLAKLNTEEEPELATDYGIRGIPNVKIFKDGEVVDEFTGLIPEAEIQALLQKHIQTEVDLFFKEVGSLTKQEKLKAFQSRQNQFESNLKFLWHYGELLFQEQQFEKALEVFALIPKLSEFEDQITNMTTLIEFLSFSKKNPSDKFETLLIQAAQAYQDNRMEDALNFLTDLLFRKKDYLDGNAKKIALALIQQCDDEEKKATYFRRISMAVNS